MALILLTTVVHAPQARVFDLTRSIDVHQVSAKQTGERAIGGITKGLISLNEEVTWEARHFGLRQRLTVRVTAFAYPDYFQTTMVQGSFRTLIHDHTFRPSAAGTEMVDRFAFESPLGFLGRTVDRVFLSGYLRRFLRQRSCQLKQLAESEAWRKYLGGK